VSLVSDTQERLAGKGMPREYTNSFVSPCHKE
jgi:hypothetical protein